ncbi:hypothetical protein [Mucilaginibacter pedocola]|uniref:Lipoprotein n=1 Tax=Mucilaginibacter pedocola TaxID=1792845 RepID=A0A1S9PBL1_9SPHI|nr:hypothetical protein [Mucilaginibacter pedocola]OOQ58319.1 hypothetical protein BC343_11840 [Mucilaginibacter pedocola]
MRKPIFTLFNLLLIFAFYSCGYFSIKKYPERKKVEIVCLVDNDTLHVKIVNNSDSVIYIPEDYEVDFTSNTDTLYMSVVNKEKYGVTYFYKYSKVFPFEFYTAKKIDGVSPDTTVKIKSQVNFYNQFKIHGIREIKSGASYITRLVFDIPKHLNVVQVNYYRKLFLNTNRLDTIDYSKQDVLLYDSLNSVQVNVLPVTRFR